MLNVLTYVNAKPIEGLLNVWPHQLETNPQLVSSMIAYRENKAVKIGARELTITELAPVITKDFLKLNHLNGTTAGTSFRYGLVDKAGKLFMVITLGKPRYTKSFDLEVLRMATLHGYAVQGGASKLFKHILAKHSSASILSYSDRLHGDGSVYQLVGFQHLGSTGLGYFWEKQGIILPRHRTQKHLLLELLGDVDLTQSELTLMMNAGWQRVFDLGHHRWGLGTQNAAVSWQSSKAPSTAGRTWVQRESRQQLVIDPKSTDLVEFKQLKTNKGKIVLVRGNERKLFPIDEREQLMAEGWSSPVPPTSGKIGMRSLTGVKRLVSLDIARELAAIGWVIAAKKLSSAPAQVQQFAQELLIKNN